eukprot:TRINITY_DN88649_c0_g1_i1.p1 TRINITY_DN88649_c0_g1~~TRINITY_DN88649_c0_g1_i1.p1  ORF type:complete len:228 (+),score=16.14 TRINITY_DN88649_c0_g1_i1:29-712(+)
MNDKERSKADKYTDTIRKPLEVLQWAGLQKTDKVLDVSSGYGYWAEIMAGITSNYPIDCHNASEWQTYFKNKGWEKKAADLLKHAQKFNWFWTSFNDPANSAAAKYDFVLSYANYHDLYDLPVDRQKFLQSIRHALTPNGKFLLMDHRAKPGRGAKDAGANKGLHRIDEALVRKEIAQAGFMIVKESNIFNNPKDDYSMSAWTNPMHPRDRFCFLLVPVNTEEEGQA